MSEFAGVDPKKVQQLADRLRVLAETLEREGSVIQRVFAAWQGTINQSLLAQQITQVRVDARDMAHRADLARLLELQPVPRADFPGYRQPGWVDMPWDMAAVDAAPQGQQAALLLQHAMDHPDASDSRAVISAVAQSVADHQGDPTYLETFMANGGMDLSVRAARVLQTQDYDKHHSGPVLKPESERILTELGQSLQAATTFSKQGRLKLPWNYEQILSHPAKDDMWSAGMLFKYGPPGDKWDPHVLSVVGGAMLDWRDKSNMRPEFTAYTKGVAVRQPNNDWYRSLGLGGYWSNSPDGGRQGSLAINDFDPSIVLMQRVSENPDASREILTGPSGLQHAKALVSDKWQTPGPVPIDPVFPALVIRNAALDRAGHLNESAQAAANVIEAGALQYQTREQYKNPEDLAQYPVSRQMTQALSSVFMAYVSDFAAGTTNGDRNTDIDPNHPDRIEIGVPQAERFLCEIMQNKDEAGNVIQSINAQVKLNSTKGLDDPLTNTVLNQLAALRGEVQTAGLQVDLRPAALLDAENAKKQLWWNITGSLGAAIPGGGLVKARIQAALWAYIPYHSADFATNNAAKVESHSGSKEFDAKAGLKVPLLQGLVISRKLAPPASHPEWADGNFDGSTDPKQFDSWWREAMTYYPGLAAAELAMRVAFQTGVDAPS